MLQNFKVICSFKFNPGKNAYNYFPCWQKQNSAACWGEKRKIKIFGWEKSSMAQILAGKSILLSTASWLRGADIIFPHELIINQ